MKEFGIVLIFSGILIWLFFKISLKKIINNIKYSKGDDTGESDSDDIKFILYSVTLISKLIFYILLLFGILLLILSYFDFFI